MNLDKRALNDFGCPVIAIGLLPTAGRDAPLALSCLLENAEDMF